VNLRNRRVDVCSRSAHRAEIRPWPADTRFAGLPINRRAHVDRYGKLRTVQRRPARRAGLSTGVFQNRPGRTGKGRRRRREDFRSPVRTRPLDQISTEYRDFISGDLTAEGLSRLCFPIILRPSTPSANGLPPGSSCVIQDSGFKRVRPAVL
jgi:hypothetical protein